MGGSKSKALYNAPSARVVLARRQQEMEAVANLSKAPVAPPSQPSPSLAPRIPAIDVVPPVHSKAPKGSQVKASGYDNNVPLSPDILKEVAKWNVVKTHTMGSKTSEAQSNKVKSAVEVRQQLEKSEAAQGSTQGAKLSELQVHELFKSMRDQPTTSSSALAAKYNISEEDIKDLQSFARYPTVVVDPDDAQSKIAY